MTRDEAKQWITVRYQAIIKVVSDPAPYREALAKQLADLDALTDEECARQWGKAENSPFIIIQHDGEGNLSITEG